MAGRRAHILDDHIMVFFLEREHDDTHLNLLGGLLRLTLPLTCTNLADDQLTQVDCSWSARARINVYTHQGAM
jgi:hypothetical protein